MIGATAAVITALIAITELYLVDTLYINRYQAIAVGIGLSILVFCSGYVIEELVRWALK